MGMNNRHVTYYRGPMLNPAAADWLGTAAAHFIATLKKQGTHVPDYANELVAALKQYADSERRRAERPHSDLDYVPIAVAAKMAGVSVPAVHRWIDTGKVHGLKVNNRWQINVDHVDDMINLRAVYNLQQPATTDPDGAHG